MSVDPEETEFLGSYMKGQIMYGSTGSNLLKKEKYFTHYVQSSDTLQGIALRYGVSMEHIKRANKMWTADSLSLRPTLNIPIIESSPAYSTSSSLASTPTNGRKSLPNSSSCQQNFSSIDIEEVSIESPSSSSDQTNGRIRNGATAGPSSLDAESSKAEKDESIVDFLLRIDSSISKTKSQVMQCEDKLTSPRTEQVPGKFTLSYDRPTSSNSKMKRPRSLKSTQNHSAGSSWSLGSSRHSSDVPETRFLTEGSKVRQAQRKHEEDENNMFEL